MGTFTEITYTMPVYEYWYGFRIGVPNRQADCDADGLVDSWQIAIGARADANANFVPDICECTGDLDGDGMVAASDITVLLTAWGNSGSSPADLNGDQLVNGADLTILLGSWGGCP